MKPVIVGEHNPYGSSPEWALYPSPPESAGGRLCRLVMGLSEDDYLRLFRRANLLATARWSAPAAREAAGKVDLSCGAVLLGSRVARAFGLAARGPFSVVDFDSFSGSGPIVLLPHPSGRCRAWNEPGAFDRAREALSDAFPEITFGRVPA